MTKKNGNHNTDDSNNNGNGKTIKGNIKLDEPIIVTGDGSKEPVNVTVVNQEPIQMNLSNKVPLNIDLGDKPINFNLNVNERSKNEFTINDFFGLIKNMHNSDSNESTIERLITVKKKLTDNLQKDIEDEKTKPIVNQLLRDDYKRLKYEIETGIDEMFPNDKSFYSFSSYLPPPNEGKDFNYLNKIIDHHNWADVKYPPGIELIYNYWMDEGYTTFTLLAITERYRNRPGRWSENLLGLTLDPLRRVNNYLMGYIKDLRIGDLLTLEERSLEYQNQYGYFIPTRKGTDGLEIRSNFHSAFNKLLYECSNFYEQFKNKFIVPDALPVLIALQELNIILATGDINQAVSFAKRARTQVMIEQFILERPEIGEYLKERPMVPYKYEWMRRVDAMKTLQKWNPDNSIRLFSDLAEYGEIILLGVRFIDWSNISNQDFAKAWALYFKNEIETYIQKYYSVTNVDLKADMLFMHDFSTRRISDVRHQGRKGIAHSSYLRTRDVLPSVLIRQRIKQTV